jgi:DNA-binding CsgD family transcriptional regulator
MISAEKLHIGNGSFKKENINKSIFPVPNGESEYYSTGDNSFIKVKQELLSEREKKAVQLAIEGYNCKEIGIKMGGISKRTAQSHLIHAYGKLNVNSVKEIIARNNIEFIDLQRIMIDSNREAISTLTPREKDIWREISLRDESYPKLAKDIFMSGRTLGSIAQRIFAKLGIARGKCSRVRAKALYYAFNERNPEG